MLRKHTNIQTKSFIDKYLHYEHLRRKLLFNPNKYILETPIANVVKQVSDFIIYGNACHEAGGGFVDDWSWRRVQWHDEIILSPLKLKLYKKTLKMKRSNFDKSSWVCCREYSLWSNDFYKSISLLVPKWIPHTNKLTDNTTSKSWIWATSSNTNEGDGLQRLLYSLLINNLVGLRVGYITAECNILTDDCNVDTHIMRYRTHYLCHYHIM